MHSMHCVLDMSRMSCYFVCVDHKTDNFIVGLTNVSPVISKPTLYNYTLCGQYPGAVPNGTTVSLYCQDNLPPFRYVIVQLPNDQIHFVACEIEVLVRGTRMSNINILTFTFQAENRKIITVIKQLTFYEPPCIEDLIIKLQHCTVSHLRDAILYSY